MHLPVIALILAATFASTFTLDPEDPEWNLLIGKGR